MDLKRPFEVDDAKPVGKNDEGSLGLKKKRKEETALVCVDGKKLRAGTIPWRYAASSKHTTSGSSKATLEVLLIEGINTPGKWSFPGGSLDPGEEVSDCAVRETAEESGAFGSLGCFLGVFENEKHRAYIFLLQVHTVRDEGNEFWHDPYSAYESDGRRRRKWFAIDDAKPMLKKDGGKLLDAFLTVPSDHRSDTRWRAAAHLSPVSLPTCKGIVSNILVLGWSPFVQDYCKSKGKLIPGGPAASQLDGPLTKSQRFAIFAASLWEADIIICIGGNNMVFSVGLAAASGQPTLFLHSQTADKIQLLQADSRITFCPISNSEHLEGEEQAAISRQIDLLISQRRQL